MVGGIYRGEKRLWSGIVVKYQVARSAVDAERRAVEFDDPCWKGVRFRFVERVRCPRATGWQAHNQIVAARS